LLGLLHAHLNDLLCFPDGDFATSSIGHTI
jgi:hypothetical protein